MAYGPGLSQAMSRHVDFAVGSGAVTAISVAFQLGDDEDGAEMAAWTTTPCELRAGEL